jgi:hypothetical protein
MSTINDPSFIPSLGISFGLMFLTFYLLPFWIAFARRHNVGKVFWINFLFGWSFVGWVIALVLALQAKPFQISLIPNAIIIQALREKGLTK